MTVYRTVGPWGAGKGANLSPAEVDDNFWDHDQRIEDLETNPVAPITITSIALSGTSFTMGLSDGSTVGPIVFAIPMPVWRGAWAPTTSYQALNFFTAPSGELGVVLIAHTSAASFDWAATDIVSGDPLYQNISGSSSGALSGLSDIDFSSLADGDVLTYDSGSGKWVNVPVAAGVSDLDDLDDVTLTVPADLDVLQYNAGSGKWENTALSVSELDDLTDVDTGGKNDGDSLYWNDGASEWQNRPRMYFVNPPTKFGTLSSNEIIAYHKFTRSVEFNINFGALFGHTSQAGAGVAATGSPQIDIQKAVAATPTSFTDVGSITFAAGANVGTKSTTGFFLDFDAGDVMRIRGPSSADGTLANVYMTLVGYEI